jgi:hypothetical protein
MQAPQPFTACRLTLSLPLSPAWSGHELEGARAAVDDMLLKCVAPCGRRPRDCVSPPRLTVVAARDAQRAGPQPRPTLHSYLSAPLRPLTQPLSFSPAAGTTLTLAPC